MTDELKIEVELSEGKVTFGSWKNKEQNKAYYRSLNDSDIIGIKNSELRDKAIMKKTQDWLLACSVFNGTGFLKGNTIEETNTNIDNLDVIEATKLGQAFNEFATAMSESIKKK